MKIIIFSFILAILTTSCAWSEEIASAQEHLSQNVNVVENPAPMPTPDTTRADEPDWSEWTNSNDSVPISFNVTVNGWVDADTTEVNA